MTKRSTNDKIDMWNGGETFGNKDNHFNRMWRESEDYHDELDSESTTRESLVKRQKIMDKTRIKRTEEQQRRLYNRSQEDYNEKTPVSGMGGVKRTK